MSADFLCYESKTNLHLSEPKDEATVVLCDFRMRSVPRAVATGDWSASVLACTSVVKRYAATGTVALQSSDPPPTKCTISIRSFSRTSVSGQSLRRTTL